MSGCNVNDGKRGDAPRMANCPLNGDTYEWVPRKTLMHQLKSAWLKDLPKQGYYFCNSPDCDVVYFGEDGRLFPRHALRLDVGQKSRANERTLCYCFDVNFADAVDKKLDAHGRTAREYVIEQTRDGTCDCVVRNPSGKCCLKDFPV